MRILLVANTLPPTDLSGVGEQVMQLASGLESRGHEVDILGRGADGAPGPKLLFPLTVGPAFLRRLRRFKPHVVQVHESDGVLAAFLTRLLASVLTPAPVLVALLQVSYRREIAAVRPLVYAGKQLGRPGRSERRFRLFKAPVQVLFGALSAWLADLVLAPSEVTAGEIRSDYGVSSVGVVPNVTGGLAWDATSLERSAERQGFLYVGRLRVRKGVEVLLEALTLLTEGASDSSLSIVGDGEQRQALEAFVRSRRLGERVRFLGRKSPEQVRALVASARALVVPSIYEGMPLVILEAMEQGTPVVASAVSGIPEVVVDGETGWLVPPEDPPKLAQALAALLDNPGEARRRGEAGRERVQGHFRPANAARRWEASVLPFLGAVGRSKRTS